MDTKDDDEAQWSPSPNMYMPRSLLLALNGDLLYQEFCNELELEQKKHIECSGCTGGMDILLKCGHCNAQYCEICELSIKIHQKCLNCNNIMITSKLSSTNESENTNNNNESTETCWNCKKLMLEFDNKFKCSSCSNIYCFRCCKLRGHCHLHWTRCMDQIKW